MTWPASDVVTTNADAGTDSPATFRADVLDLLTKFNLLRNHVGSLGQTLLNRGTAALMRTDLGSTAIGDAVFVAASAAAARGTLVAAQSGANGDITSLTALAAGGLPDNSVLTADIAALQVTGAKIAAATITPDKLNGAQSGSAPIFGARAWCVFNGTLTGTNAPTAGGNVSSVTRNSAGNYTINFATAMPDANYSVVTTSTASSSGPTLLSSSAFIAGVTYTAPTTTAFIIGTQTAAGGSLVDPTYPVCVAVFR